MDVAAADPDTVLDTLDRRLVCALQVNGRAGAGRIAEVLGVSPRTVTRRLVRLQQTGLVRVVRMPDVEDAAVGALLLRIRVLRGKGEAVARALAERPDVPFVDVMLGGQEVGAVMLTGAGARDRLLNGQLPATAAVTETTVHAVLHAFADAGQWRSGHLEEAEAAALAEPPAARPAPGSVSLDALDRDLLARLGEDARQSHAMLAAAAGTPSPPSGAGCTGWTGRGCCAPMSPSTRGCWGSRWTPTCGWTCRRAARGRRRRAGPPPAGARCVRDQRAGQSDGRGVLPGPRRPLPVRHGHPGPARRGPRRDGDRGAGGQARGRAAAAAGRRGAPAARRPALT